MTYLTLYKKCILNNSYTEVFNMKKTIEKDGNKITVLDDYLSTLEQFRYDDDFIYAQQAGSFQIELYPVQNEDDIYSYNYLKIQEIDDDGKEFKRYCFIDNITKIASNIVTINYSEDVWSSYSDSMQIRDGIISNKRRNPKAPYYLPVQYDGNNQPVFKPLINNDIKRFYIIAQLQLYKLGLMGEITNRRVKTVILCNKFEYDGGVLDKPTLAIFSDLRTINEIYANQASSDYLVTSSSQETSYQIDNITLVPCELFSRAGVPDLSGFTDLFAQTKEETNRIYFAALRTNRSYGRGVDKLSNFGISTTDFTVVSIGTLFHQYEITINGSEINIEIEIRITDFDCKILLYVQNKIIDITNDFVLKVPYNSLTSEQNTQKKIERQMETMNGVFNIIEGSAKTGVQIAGAVYTGGLSLVGGSVIDTIAEGNYRYSNIDRQLTSERATSTTIKRDRQSVGGVVGSARQIANGITEVIYANKPKYSSSYGTFSTTEGYMNVLAGGLGVLTIKPDNIEYVQNILNKTGYTVFMPVQSYNDVFENMTLPDIIRMSMVILYGNFAQDINSKLTNILKNGIRVFNSSSVNIIS